MRILVVMNAKEVRLGGGIIQVIINFKKGFENRNDFKFDYAINLQENSGIEKLLADERSNLFLLPNKSKNIFKYAAQLLKICKNGNYDVVHVHGSSSTIALELACAYFARRKRRIAHSHNSMCSHPRLNVLLNPFLRLLSTDAIACSSVAGRWLFGDGNYTVIHNAFDISAFRFEECVRKEQRALIDQCREDTIILGMVGNLNAQKNPAYALELFDQIRKQLDARLVYIGDGPLKNQLLRQSYDMGLNRQVVFMGVCNDVPKKLQMIDIFLFPSEFEGLGISILEAQIAGCICVASTNVPIETKYSQETKYISLEEKNKWIEAIMLASGNCNCTERRKERSISVKNAIEKDYGLNREVQKLVRIYEGKKYGKISDL